MCCCFFATELLSRYLEYFWLHHSSWQHHWDNCGFAGEQLQTHWYTLATPWPTNKKQQPQQHQPKTQITGFQEFFSPSFPGCNAPCLPDATKVALRRLSPSVFHILSVPVSLRRPHPPSTPPNPPPSLSLWLGRPSRWTPSTWASWSFSERLAWSSCWGRATPSVSCCGPSYNLSRCSSLSSRSEILMQACRELVRTDAEIILTASNQWRLLLSPPTGSSLRLSPHRDAFLHIRHHWHAGTFPLKNHKWHDGATLRSNVNGF